MKKTMTHEKLTVKQKPVRFFKVNFNRPAFEWEEVEPDWRKTK